MTKYELRITGECKHIHSDAAKIRARLCRLLPQGRKNFS